MLVQYAGRRLPMCKSSDITRDTDERAMYTMSSPSSVATEKLSRSTADIRSRIGWAAVDSEFDAE